MTTDDELRELIALGDKATPRPWRGDRYDGTVKYGIKGGSDNGYVLLYNDDAERSQFSRDLGNCDDEFIIAAANLAPEIAAELIAARFLVEQLRKAIESVRDVGWYSPVTPEYKAAWKKVDATLKGGDL